MKRCVRIIPTPVDNSTFARRDDKTAGVIFVQDAFASAAVRPCPLLRVHCWSDVYLQCVYTGGGEDSDAW